MAKVAQGGQRLKSSTLDIARSVDRHHEKIADHTDSLAKATRVAGTIAVAGAFVAAPTGLTAAGVALGLVSAPLIATVAPAVAGVAAGAAALSAGASLYAKLRRRRQRLKTSTAQEAVDAGSTTPAEDNQKLPG